MPLRGGSVITAKPRFTHSEIWREKSASFDRVGHLTASGTRSLPPYADGSPLPFESAAGACVFSGKVLMSLLISRRFARKPPQHRLHMVLNRLLVGLRSALRRLSHPTLLHPAVRARSGRDDNRFFGDVLCDLSHTIRSLGYSHQSS